mmetsp:Transcript_8882/g.16015  ORF Transcript_8882/g.16015 Transcript_8882/m.16015 type:complete len:314 (+) Transcript_8882:136-1077(+)
MRIPIRVVVFLVAACFLVSQIFRFESNTPSPSSSKATAPSLPVGQHVPNTNQGAHRKTLNGNYDDSALPSNSLDDARKWCSSDAIIGEVLEFGSASKFMPVSKDPRCANVKFMVPQMSVPARMELYSRVKNSKTYLEWGSGGSTNTFALLAEKAYSIEHFQPWCSNVKLHELVAFHWAIGQLNYICVELPDHLQIMHAGFPHCHKDREDNDACSEAMRPYIDAVHHTQEQHFDVVLVDGRYRVAAALKALAFVDTSSVVAVHDWLGREAKYGVLLEFYDRIDLVQELMLLRPKPHFVGDTELWKRFMKNQFAP